MRAEPALPNSRPLRPTRGAASLVVVMVLFFIISMVAAYTSRNLIFEQRTSANQYRSTLAFEAADAGVEWALSRLNDARMNADCTPLPNAAAVSAVTPEPSFRERYLGIDPVSGQITPLVDRLAGCVFDGIAWSCDCPAAGEPAPTFVANGAGPHVAFWLRFAVIAGRPGVVRVEVNGCTRNDPSCLRFNREAQAGDGLSGVSAVLALRSALGTPPAAALTVRGPTTVVSGAILDVTNADPGTNGLTVHSGSAFAVGSPPAIVLRTLPGTPVARSVIENDPGLTLLDLAPPLVPATPANNGVDRMFNSVFGMWPGTFVEQPALVRVDCRGGCTSGDINDALLLKPGQAIHAWGAGPLVVDVDIGTAIQPAMIVADGSIQFAGAPTVRGVVYSRAATWTTDSSGTFQGAAIAEDMLRIVGAQTVVYDPALIARLRNTTGSFVKVPGGWRDYAP